MSKFNIKKRLTIILLILFSIGFSLPAMTDSSSPLLAAYYDRYLTICGSTVYEWNANNAPIKLMSSIKQVGVGKNTSYALTQQGQLLSWRSKPAKATVLMDEIHSFHAGRTGVFAIQNNGDLWYFDAKSVRETIKGRMTKPNKIASHILTASIGDSANYYANKNGELFVQGLAHRGQYGDGKLTATDEFIQTAEDVKQVIAHTGHAIILKNDGSVWGTGGNYFGPVSHHGYGDKATEWGKIFDGASAIAAGSSHTLAIKHDKSLWAWGRGEGLDPKQIMTNVDAAATGTGDNIALSQGYLWQWASGISPKKIMKCG